MLGLFTQAIVMGVVGPGHIVYADHLDCKVP